MVERTTIVVLGAAGHFGGRIARRLCAWPGLRIVLAGRREAAVRALAAGLEPVAGTSVEAAAIDIDHADFPSRLAALGPGIVVHTAGPFQQRDYRVAEACIACGSHYVDLSDGRDFVAGFDVLDAAARERGVLLVSGASTLPGLSSTVVEALRPRFERIDAVRSMIAPAHQTPRGQATVAAVLGYCGHPFRVLDDGEWRVVHGWQDLVRRRHADLGWRIGAACDVPDLELLPRWLPGLRTATFHAGLEAWWEQLAMWAMAALTRVGLVRDWTRFAPFLSALARRTAGLGSATGGMVLTVEGTAPHGRPLSVDWLVTAHRNHGPEIPCTPALAIVRRLLDGRLDRRGATACLALFDLDDFDRALGDLDVSWRIEERR